MSSPSEGHRDTQPSPDVHRQTLVARLRVAGCVFAEEEADLLLGTASGRALEDLVARRVAGEPLEHVLGRVGFAGLELVVRPGVFVPRQRTLLLAEEACRLSATAGRPVVVDLCCGVGAVGAVVAERVPRATVVAADVDPAAVACARLNLEPRGGRVYEGDLYAALPADLRGRVDVLAANAPYVPTERIAEMPSEARDFEPRVALDGGRDGLDVHRRVAVGALAWLRPGGHLLIEVARAQVAAATGLMTRAGLGAVTLEDPERGASVVVGAKPAGRA